MGIPPPIRVEFYSNKEHILSAVCRGRACLTGTSRPNGEVSTELSFRARAGLWAEGAARRIRTGEQEARPGKGADSRRCSWNTLL